MIDIKEKLDEIHRAIISCRMCPLHKTRRNAVPGDGSFSAKLMFVGEGPGEKEDIQGLPFVGKAGKLLSEMLDMIGINRKSVFITNIVKCRPPYNRDPMEEEIKTCIYYLRKQVALIKPAIICTLGRHAAKTLIRSDYSISSEHGKMFTKGSYNFFATYHPAAALYNQKLKETLIEDFKILKKHIEKYELSLRSQV